MPLQKPMKKGTKKAPYPMPMPKEKGRKSSPPMKPGKSGY